MRNCTWVCFECHAAVRRPEIAADVRCSSCARPLRNLGTKIPVPRRTDDDGWSFLERRLNAAAHAAWASQVVLSVRRRHELERQIVRLESRPHHPERARQINRLRKKIATMH